MVGYQFIVGLGIGLLGEVVWWVVEVFGDFFGQ